MVKYNSILWVFFLTLLFGCSDELKNEDELFPEDQDQKSIGIEANTTQNLVVKTLDRSGGMKYQGADQATHSSENVAYGEQTWFAVAGPDTHATGEQKEEEQYYQNQFAKTMAAFLGFNFNTG